MSVKLYTGRQGAGKSYEVCTVPIYNALKLGRRVVSNIAGLNMAEYRRLLEAEGVEPEKIGLIVPVSHIDVIKDSFWLSDEKLRMQLDLEKRLDDKSLPNDVVMLIEGQLDACLTVIQPGDLVVLDEVWRFWDGFGSKDVEGFSRPPSVMNFFRMHRHLIDPLTGVACDIILITQVFSDVSRSVLGVVEETYYFEKLTLVGKPTMYRMDIHSGGKRMKSNLMNENSFPKSYNPDFFCLYQSHSLKQEGSAVASELNADDRANILKGWWPPTKKTYVVAVFGLLVVFVSLWGILRVFDPATFNKKHVLKAANVVSGVGVASGGVAVSGVGVGRRFTDVLPSADSGQWRVVGWFSSNLHLVAVLKKGVYFRYLYDPNPLDLTWAGDSISVRLTDNSVATMYSGEEVSGNVKSR